MIAESSGRPRWTITIDMLWAAVRHETAFQDYFDWDFHTLNRRERETARGDIATPADPKGREVKP